MNEAGGYRRSNLTKEQKRDAEAAIFGLPTQKVMDQFSPEDIERMRAVLAQHDATNARQGIKEFDLNNPPKEQYRYQRFPEMVYHHETRVHKTVRNEAEEKAALAAGFQLEAFASDPPVDELSAEDQAEAERLDKIARLKKKQPKE